MSESGIPERNIMEAGHWKDQKAFRTCVVKKRDLSVVEIWNEIDMSMPEKMNGQRTLDREM